MYHVFQVTDSAEVNECSVSDLRKGKAYYFRVCAVTKYGKGPYVELTEAVIAEDPLEPPGPPLNLSYSNVKVDNVTLTWSAPKHDGGSKITSEFF